MRTFPLLCLCVFILAGGCTSKTPREIPASYRAEGLLLPSKDHLWATEGQNFSASEFEALEERFPPLSPQNRLRLSQYLSLHAAFLQENEALSALRPEQFAEDLRGLFPPVPSGFDPEAFQNRIKTRYRADSVEAWKNRLDQMVQAKHFEWNRALLQEYGINP